MNTPFKPHHSCRVLFISKMKKGFCYTLILCNIEIEKLHHNIYEAFVNSCSDSLVWIIRSFSLELKLPLKIIINNGSRRSLFD